jgi:hypothetical protein
LPFLLRLLQVKAGVKESRHFSWVLGWLVLGNCDDVLLEGVILRRRDGGGGYDQLPSSMLLLRESEELGEEVDIFAT